MAAGNVLVALARSHFHFAMSELQSHLKALGKVPDEIVLLTLGRMAHSYALRSLPLDKQAVLGAVGVLRVLLHEEQHRERGWEQLTWLLHQDQEAQTPPR
ncbi:LOW QUALITY PROTEIN: maestro heat-like repeat-containing protein family member 2B [Aegotheles albertisi]